LLRGLKVEKGGGVELAEVLTFFWLRVKVAARALSTGITTLTPVLD